MANEVGNPSTGIGLHEATLAISNLLGPEEDNQEETEALDRETGQEAETEEVEEYEEETEYEETDYEEDSDPDEENDEEEVTQELPEDPVP